MLKLVIFDLDGTLMDAYRAVWSSINYSFKKAGYPSQSHQMIKRSVGWGDVSLIRRFVAESDADRVVKIYRRHHSKVLAQGVSLLPGAKKTLELLRSQKVRMAIASNRPNRFTLIALKALKIRHYFDAVVCADKVKRGKPHPDMFRKILKQLSVRPSETAFVGDMTIDALAGKRAGLKTIIVLTGSCSRGEILPHKPQKIIKSLKELPQILLKPAG